MRADGPVCQGIDLGAALPRGIVTGETHLTAGTVFDEEILGDEVFGLDVRIVAGYALDVTVDELDCSCGVSGFGAADE